jgi:hypothetical protein
MNKQEKVKQGKRNKINGAKFENLVRKDLESRDWVVSKWQNNVEFEDCSNCKDMCDVNKRCGKLIPAKRKYNPITKRPMAEGTGFPDFICYKGVLDKFSKYKSEIILVEIGRENLINDIENEVKEVYEIIGVEAKTNGYLDKEEKQKCKWLLDKKIFSRILIASKNGKEIKYKEFEND